MFAISVKFTRYSNETGDRQNSAPLFFHAKDWAGAIMLADAVLIGMREADPEQIYDIASVARDGLGGKTMDGFGGIWIDHPGKSKAA